MLLLQFNLHATFAGHDVADDRRGDVRSLVLDQLPPFVMQAALIAVASLWRGQS